jgi:hypothetical protein
VHDLDPQQRLRVVLRNGQQADTTVGRLVAHASVVRGVLAILGGTVAECRVQTPGPASAGAPAPGLGERASSKLPVSRGGGVQLGLLLPETAGAGEPRVARGLLNRVSR